jgi:hypothetical protein
MGCMRRRRTTSLSLLLLYAAALVLAPCVERVLPGAQWCVQQLELCSSAVADVDSPVAATALLEYGSWSAQDAGRLTERGPTGRPDHRIDGASSTSDPQRARAVVSTFEHRSVRARIRVAETGLSAAAPRAPPFPA